MNLPSFTVLISALGKGTIKFNLRSMRYHTSVAGRTQNTTMCAACNTWWLEKVLWSTSLPQQTLKQRASRFVPLFQEFVEANIFLEVAARSLGDFGGNMWNYVKLIQIGGHSKVGFVNQHPATQVTIRVPWPRDPRDPRADIFSMAWVTGNSRQV